MSFNNVIPVWIIVVGQAQEDYRDGLITYEEAVEMLDSVKATEGCYTVLDEIKDGKQNDEQW